VSVGGLAIIVDNAGSELLRFGWLKNACFSGTGGEVEAGLSDVSESGLSKESGGSKGGADIHMRGTVYSVVFV